MIFLLWGCCSGLEEGMDESSPLLACCPDDEDCFLHGGSVPSNIAGRMVPEREKERGKEILAWKGGNAAA